jgi:uncharacterized protein
MTATDNKAIVTQIMRALSQGNTAPFADAMADDFTWRMMGTETSQWSAVYAGKQSVRRDLFGQLFTQFADQYTSTPRHIFAEGQHVIVETQGAVTTKQGERYCNNYCLVIRMADGKMREVREYLDTALADARLQPLAR